MEPEIASDDDDAPMDDDRHAQTLLAWLEKRSLCRAYIVNRLGLALDWDETLQARKLGFLQQEWFCAMRDAGNQLQENLYTPQNTLEMRLYELISFRGLGRMRRILTEVKNADGKWERYVLMHPPQHAGKDARRRGVQADPALRKWHNEMMGIYVNRPVYSPSPIASDWAIRAAARRLLQERTVSVHWALVVSAVAREVITWSMPAHTKLGRSQLVYSAAAWPTGMTSTSAAKSMLHLRHGLCGVRCMAQEELVARA